jgi:hypothetical protein
VKYEQSGASVVQEAAALAFTSFTRAFCKMLVLAGLQYGEMDTCKTYVRMHAVFFLVHMSISAISDVKFFFWSEEVFNLLHVFHVSEGCFPLSPSDKATRSTSTTRVLPPELKHGVRPSSGTLTS